MKTEELNPFIRYASTHYNYYANNENSVCYDCRLFFIVQGEGTFIANDQNFNIMPNLALFLPPKTHYRFIFTNNEHVKIYVLNFDLTDKFSFITTTLGTDTESNFDPQKVPNYDLPQEFSRPIVQENGILIRKYVADCTELFLQKSVNYKHYASAYIKIALLELLNEAHNKKTDYRLIKNIQEFIHKNYQNADINNCKIAEQFNYHPYHISRLMKIYTKKTLHDYLINYRLNMAKNYLRTTSFNITEIAEKTGFSSYSYFIKIFREKIGVSPLQYRKQNKNKGF